MKFPEYVDAEFNGRLTVAGEKHVKVSVDHEASKHFGRTAHFQEW